MLLAIAAVGAPSVAAARPRRPGRLSTSSVPRSICTGDAATAVPVGTDSTGAPTGFYVAPKRRPRALVIFSHGHTASPYQWFVQMARVARRDNAIGVAMYYPGEKRLDGGQTTYGWRVREGAQAGIAAARMFVRACPSLASAPVIDYGVSMGGNTSGLIAAAGAKRPNGRRLFDYWFDIEGVTNVVETYLEATVVAQLGNATGVQAKREIEEENGGTLDQVPAAYRDLAVINHGPEIAAAAIKRVVMVHGIQDGTVPYNQTPEMQTVLARYGVPTDFYSVLTKTPNTESGSTLDGLLPFPHDSPFAGHGGEGSTTQLVIQTGMGALDTLLTQGGGNPVGHRVFLVDGTVGQTVPILR